MPNATSDEGGIAVRAPTSSQLRHALDSGAGADKTPFSDPAAAPLGADDEASGVSPTPDQRRLAYAQEVEGRPAERDAHASAKVGAGASVGPTVRRARGPRAPWLIAAGGVALVVVVWLGMSALGLDGG